jgi:NAD kinase
MFFFLLILSIIGIIIYKGEYFKKIDPTILTLVSGSIGFIISKIFEDLKESKQRIYEQKRKYYNELIRPFRDVLKNIKTKNGNSALNTKQIADAMDTAFDNILYASDDVIEKYGQFKNNSTNEEQTGSSSQYKTLKLFSSLLLAMRKDLGNKYTSLDEVHILRMFINMSKVDEVLYRKEFKKIK